MAIETDSQHRGAQETKDDAFKRQVREGRDETVSAGQDSVKGEDNLKTSLQGITACL